MPVIRSRSSAKSPARPDSADGLRPAAAPSPAEAPSAAALRPAAAPPAAGQPPPVAAPRPAADLRREGGNDQQLLAEIVQALKASVDQSNHLTHSRLLRGLEALDDRIAERNAAAQVALTEHIADVEFRVKDLEKMLAETAGQSEQRMSILEGRIYEALGSLVNVVRQLRAEVAALGDSLSAFQSESRLNDQSRRQSIG